MNINSEKLYVVNLLEQYQSFEQSDREQVFRTLSALPNVDVVLGNLSLEAEQSIRCFAIEALLKISRRRGLATSKQLLRDQDWVIRWYVCGLLHDFGDSSVVEDLVERLSDSNAKVRLTAAYALELVGDERALTILEYVRDNDVGEDEDGRMVSDFADDAINSIRQRLLKK